jgi:predicted phage tail protein
MVSLERFGFVSKTFLVTDWQLAVRGDGDAPRLGIDLVLRETDANVFAWSADEENPLPAAPSTTLPDPFTVQPPTGLSVTSQPTSLPDGTVLPGLLASWTASVDGFVVGYEVRIKKTADADWSAPVSSGAELRLAVVGLASESYDAQVRAVNNLGVPSDWTATVSATPSGDTTPPGLATSVSATGGAGQIAVSWTNPGDSDFNRSRVFASDSNDSGTAVQIGADVYGLPGQPSTYTETGLGSSVTRYYWIKTVDVTGNASGFSAGTSATTDP